jgi:hypothetical protein
MLGHVFTNEASMMEPRRPIALAAAFTLTLGAGAASAQTVLVRNAPPDSTLELVLNTDPIGTAKADARGIATLPVDLSANLKKTETDAQVFVDVCADSRRVLIVERAVSIPLPEPGCTRRDMGGIFVVRQISTLVVDFAQASPTLMLRQGRVSLEPARVWGAPSGLVIFGGGGFTDMGNSTLQACGSNPTDCTGDDFGTGFTAGASFWIGPYIAAEGSYVRPAKATAEGSGTGFRFDSEFDSEMITVAGKVGAPIRSVRIYGKIGANYHRATFRTTQQVDEATITVDGVEQTIPGGNQVYWVKTAGWGWLFGGGVEVWVAPSFGIYGEVGRAALKGIALDEEDGATDERVTTMFVGARIRIGG